MQDFFQLLQPGLQLLRPPKKDYKGPLLANMVPYTAQSFIDEWGMQPSQVQQPLKHLPVCLSLSVCWSVCVLSDIGRYTLHTCMSVSTTHYSIRSASLLLQVDACCDCPMVCLSVCDHILTSVHVAGLQSLPRQCDGLTVYCSVCLLFCLAWLAGWLAVL